MNLVGNPNGLTFSGPWSFRALPDHHAGGGSGNLVTLSGVISGTGGFNANSSATSGTLEMIATNSYTGTTTVSNGWLQLGDGVSRNGSVTGDIAVGSPASAAHPGSLVFANPNAQTYAKVIAAMERARSPPGPGILTLSNVNTYSNATSIAGSTVKLGVNNALPGGAYKGDVTIAATGKLDMGGFSDSINGLNGVSGAMIDSTGANTYTLTVGVDSDPGTFGGVIQNTSGTVALTVAGGSTLTLSGANTYSGNTIINASTPLLGGSTLTVGANNTIPAGSSVVVGNGATLDMNGSYNFSDTIAALTAPASSRTSIAISSPRRSL